VTGAVRHEPPDLVAPGPADRLAADARPGRRDLEPDSDDNEDSEDSQDSRDSEDVVGMSDKTDEPEVEAAAGGKKKLIVVVLVVLLLVGGAGYWFVLKPKGGAKAAPQPGVVVKLDSIQVNLQSDHYLKLGIALQASKDAGEEVDGSKALDQAIDVFSGQDMQDLERRAYREKMKKRLDKRLEKVYDGKVIGAYFTDFVTQ
jgi:flagellar FliL protein